MKSKITVSVLSLIIIVLAAGDIFSIPAFARKYNMSCKTCHSPAPYLKSYGNEFAGNGFQLLDKEAPRYYVETGDERLDLIRDIPLAIRIQGFLTYTEESNNQFDLGSPNTLKLLSGGAISKDIGYYAYYILEYGKAGKIEDAWLMFNNLFGSELDFTIGQFQVSDPVFKRELRLTNEDYIIYKVRPGNSGIDLTYDRGIFISYGFPWSIDLTLEVVNGSGIGELYSNNLFDKDKYKNVAVRLSKDITDNFRLGTLGYYGNELVGRAGMETRNELWMAGGDATISFDIFELNLQYLQREDKDPFALEVRSPDNIKTEGGFAELIFRPFGDESSWYAAAVYNHVNSDDKSIEYKSAALHWGYILKRNIRLIAETGYDIKNESGKIGVGFVTAF